MAEILHPPLAEVRVYAYRLPLIRPMRMLGQLHTDRRGLLLELIDTAGYLGRGEAAPFPGLHPESLQTATDSLISAASSLRGGVLPILAELPGSVRWAVTIALEELRAAATGQLLAERLWPDGYAADVELNALLSGTTDEILTEARQLQASGYRTFKLKVGRDDPAAEVRLLAQLRQLLGPTARLRLDANRAWQPAEAKAFIQAASAFDIAYLEEPLADFRGLARLQAAVDIPLALDETLLETPAFRPAGIETLIWRPNVSGRLQPPAARSLVLANAFESGVTLAQMVALAAGLAPQAMGLDTYRWLAADLLCQRPEPRAGRLNTREVASLAGQIDDRRLERLL